MNEAKLSQPTLGIPTAPPAATSTTDSNTSQFWTVFLLALFLGAFGAHRFYARKFKSGIVQLLTFGGLGFWAFIDVITILLGKFRNAEGVAYRSPKPKVAWGIFAVVCLFGIISAASNGKNDNAMAESSSTGSAKNGDSMMRKISGIYQCADPSWVLQLKSDGEFAMQAQDSGDNWQGSWSVSGNNGTLEPTTAASMTFTVANDGAITVDKYGYTFVRTQ